MSLHARTCRLLLSPSPAYADSSQPRQLFLLGVALEAAEVEEDAGLVADDLSVVTRRDGDHVAGPRFALGAVVHDNAHATREHVAEMRRLARVGPRDWIDVLGPPPAGLELDPTN